MKQKTTLNNKAIYSLVVLGILILVVSADFCSAVTNFRTVKDADSVRVRTLTGTTKVSDKRSVASGESSRPNTLTSSGSISDYQHSTGTGLQPNEPTADEGEIYYNALMNSYFEMFEPTADSGTATPEEQYLYYTTEGTIINSQNWNVADTPSSSSSHYQHSTGTGLQPSLTEADADEGEVYYNALMNSYFEMFEPTADSGTDINAESGIIKYEYTKPSYPTIEEWYTNLLTSEERPEGWTGGVQPADSGTATPEEQYLYYTTEGTIINSQNWNVADTPSSSSSHYQHSTGTGLQPSLTEADADEWEVVGNAYVAGVPSDQVLTYWELTFPDYGNDYGNNGADQGNGMASTQTVEWSDLIDRAWKTGNLQQMDNTLNQMFAEEDLSEFFASKKPSAFRIL